MGYLFARDRYKTNHVKKAVKGWKKEMRDKEIEFINARNSHKE